MLSFLMGAIARKLILCLLAGFYLVGISGLAVSGRSCCCGKSGGLLHYCCVTHAAASCCDGRPGIGRCNSTETAKEFTGPLAALQAMPRSAPIVRPAVSHIQTDPLPSEGFTNLPERPPIPA